MLETRKEIEEWLLKMNISDFIINKDLTVDVNKNVWLYNKNLMEIPVQFNIVTGRFSCYRNNLISLKGCPRVVKGNFSCKNNNLKSLNYLPIVYRTVFCDSELHNTNEYKKYLMMKALRK